MSRKQAIARYRHLRAVSKQHFGAALGFIAKPVMMEYARKLGVVHDNTIMLDDVGDFAYVYDLALYTAKEGRSRAIDRYARSIHPAPGSDEEITLRAAQAARFAVWLVEGRHDTAGLNIFDVAREQTVRLMDEGFEATLPTGVLFASRLQPVDDFVMTTGAAVPLDGSMFKDCLSGLPWSITSRVAMIEDYRFAIAVFRAYLSGESGARIKHRDTSDPLETAAA